VSGLGGVEENGGEARGAYMVLIAFEANGRAGVRRCEGWDEARVCFNDDGKIT